MRRVGRGPRTLTRVVAARLKAEFAKSPLHDGLIASEKNSRDREGNGCHASLSRIIGPELSLGGKSDIYQEICPGQRKGLNLHIGSRKHE